MRLIRAALAAAFLLTLLSLASPSQAALNVPPVGPTVDRVFHCDGSALPTDADGDGLPDGSGTCSTPTCGCNCPVVGAGVEVWAAGQDYTFAAATSGCQTAYHHEENQGTVDPTAPAGGQAWPIAYVPGGMDPREVVDRLLR